MNILVVEPGKRPYTKEISGDLESLQQTVGGYLEAIYPFDEPVALVCDEESKLKADTEWNRMLPETHDVIKGTFFLCGIGEEDFTDLAPDLMEKYKRRFWEIEHFLQIGNKLIPNSLSE